MLSKEVGWPSASHSCGHSGVGGGSCHWGRLEGSEYAAQCPECPGWWQEGWGRYWRSHLSEPSRHWLSRCSGVGPGLGQRACGRLQCLCSCAKDLLPVPAQSAWLAGAQRVCELVICRPQAPCRAGAVLPPSWPWWQLASWDGGELGFACVMGTAVSSGSMCQRTRHGHSTHG